MRNQFFFKRIEKKMVPNNENPLESVMVEKVTEYTDSFNISKVIRSISLEDGRMIVLLDDIHERIERIPIQSNKGKTINYRSERGTYQSEIYLEPEDAQRFIKLTSILE